MRSHETFIKACETENYPFPNEQGDSGNGGVRSGTIGNDHTEAVGQESNGGSSPPVEGAGECIANQDAQAAATPASLPEVRNNDDSSNSNAFVAPSQVPNDSAILPTTGRISRQRRRPSLPGAFAVGGPGNRPQRRMSLPSRYGVDGPGNDPPERRLSLPDRGFGVDENDTASSSLSRPRLNTQASAPTALGGVAWPRGEEAEGEEFHHVPTATAVDEEAELAEREEAARVREELEGRVRHLEEERRRILVSKENRRPRWRWCLCAVIAAAGIGGLVAAIVVSAGRRKKNNTTSAVFTSPEDGRCSAGFLPTCGDCWCGLDGDNEITGDPEKCPPFPREGWIDQCTANLPKLVEFYASFEPVSVPEHLKPKNLPRIEEEDGMRRLLSGEGTECNPYYHAGAPVNVNPWSDLLPCYSLINSSFFEGGKNNIDNAVCAFTYTDRVTDLDSCRGRRYKMTTYPDIYSASINGARVTHMGECGVCSNTQDFAALLNHTDSLSEKVDNCSVRQYLEVLAMTDPPTHADIITTARDCLMDSVGFTTHCALWYALHRYATTLNCLSNEKCNAPPIGSKPWRGGAPPTCAFDPDLFCMNSCDAENDFFGGGHVIGRHPLVSGILTDQVYPCSLLSQFVRSVIVHDPCNGLL